MTPPVSLKVCGVTHPAEVEALAGLGVEYVGVWHGIGGAAELSLERCRELVRAAQEAGPEPVVVTFVDDPKRLRDIVLSLRVPWLQLHGYQTPATVAAVKRSTPGATRIIKALHAHRSRCAEQALIPAYERAGADAFLLDSVAPDGRLGSTGVPLDAALASTLTAQLSRPFMLAGGLAPDAEPALIAIARRPACMGIDVDTNARGVDGAIDAMKVRAIREGWNGG